MSPRWTSYVVPKPPKALTYLALRSSGSLCNNGQQVWPAHTVGCHCLFLLRCPAVISVQYALLLLRLIHCLSVWLQWSFSSFVGEIHLACSVSPSYFSMFHWHNMAVNTTTTVYNCSLIFRPMTRLSRRSATTTSFSPKTARNRRRQ